MNVILLLDLLGDPDLRAGDKWAGGLNKTASELISHFKDKNIDIFFITTCFDNCDNKEYKTGNIHVYKFYISDTEYMNQNLLLDRKNDFIAKIKKLLHRNKYSVKLIHSLYWLSGLLALEISKELKVPYIHNVISCAHEKIITGCKQKCNNQFEIEKSIFNNANFILSISKSESNILIEHYKVHTDKIIIIGRPIDASYEELYKLKKLANKQTTNIYLDFCFEKVWSTSGAFLYVGRITKEKGLHLIIKAWIDLYQKMTDFTPPLWIIGGSIEQIDAFHSFLLQENMDISVYEVMHKIYWWGTMSSYSISSIMQKVLVLINHSKFEAGGRVVIEAMARGIPVIGAKNGFSADLIESWTNGFNVEYGNYSSLIKHMFYFAKNPFLSNSLGIQAQKTIQSFLNHNYYMVYESLYINTYVSIKHHILDYNPSCLFKVDAFPYVDLMLKDNQAFGINLMDFPLAKHCYLWESTDGTKCLVKQVYHMLNIYYFLYENESCVISLMKQYDALLQSIQLNNVYQPILIQKESFCILMEKMQTYTFIDFKFTLNSKEINDFHKSKYFTGKSRYSCYVTFIHALEEAYQVSDIRDETIENFIYYENKNIPEFEVGCNYGKSFISHIMMNKEKIVLLPSANCFYGDLGSDEARTLLELQDFDLGKAYSQLHKKYHQVYHWLGGLLLEEILLNSYITISYRTAILRFQMYMEDYIFNIK